MSDDMCWCSGQGLWVCPTHDLVWEVKATKGKPEVEQRPLPQVVHDQFVPYASLYELTLTTTQDDPYELRQSLQRIVTSGMFAIKGYIACMELTQAGIPHIHALLFSTRKYIDASKIKAMYPYRYTCKLVRMPGNYYEYINKSASDAAVLDYCIRKGIPQMWDSIPKVEQE